VNRELANRACSPHFSGETAMSRIPAYVTSVRHSIRTALSTRLSDDRPRAVTPWRWWLVRVYARRFYVIMLACGVPCLLELFRIPFPWQWLIGWAITALLYYVTAKRFGCCRPWRRLATEASWT
jgi:hypothetical protein